MTQFIGHCAGSSRSNSPLHAQLATPCPVRSVPQTPGGVSLGHLSHGIRRVPRHRRSLRPVWQELQIGGSSQPSKLLVFRASGGEGEGSKREQKTTVENQL